MRTPTRGLLLIADITGYTVFLQESELEHAQGTLTALLEIMVGGTRPPLVISQLEGDAIFSYGLEDFGMGGQTLVEMVENLYVEFRRALEMMVMNTLCTCNACANIASLDLKFFVHHGTFMTQDVGRYRELVGNDVNLIHRLTKNTVTKTTGIKAYALYTEAAVEAAGLASLATVWAAHTETYPDVGPVECRVQDLHLVWVAMADRQPVVFAPDQIVLDVSIDIDAPREVVWDRLADPVYRSALIGSDRQEVEGSVDGRTNPDSAYVCYHGKMTTRHVIVEWQPFQRVVIRERYPLPGPPAHGMQAFELEEVGNGTKLRRVVGRITGPGLYRLVGRVFLRSLRSEVTRGLERFRDQVEASLPRGGPESSLPPGSSP